MVGTSYKIRGIAPPDLAGRPKADQLRFWTFVVEIGLKVKDQELAKGLDKDGVRLRPISEYTRKHRKSAMTPTGRGDPSAPPLMPARELSRTRSLLNGRALSTHAEFFWRFDPFAGRSWGDVLRIQAEKGRDVIGLSEKGLAIVQKQALARWEAWKAGQVRIAPKVQKAALPEEMVSGQPLRGRTDPEQQRYLRETSPIPVKIPGRPKAPYPRVLEHVWGGTGKPPGAKAIEVKPPKPKPPAPIKPPAPPPKPKPVIAPRPAAMAPKPQPPAPVVPPPAPPLDSAAGLMEYGRSQGFKIEVLSPEELAKRFGMTAEEIASVPASYDRIDRTIYINPASKFFAKGPAKVTAEQAEMRWWSASRVEQVIDHEIGHARHHQALGHAFDRPELRSSFDEETTAKIREWVSGYAAQSPVEFVAEVYAGLKAGIQYKKVVMDFFVGLGGVFP
jgi:hypothetical protein